MYKANIRDFLLIIKRIFVNDVIKVSDNFLNICKNAIDKKIKIIIPNNILKQNKIEGYSNRRIIE